MNLLLDTTFSIDVLRNRNDRRQLLAEFVHAGHTLAHSTINVAEILSGVRPGEERPTDEFLAALICHSVTPTIARRAGGLKNFWSRRGVTVALADMIVAATVLEHDCVLVTDNQRDFPDLNSRLFPLPKG